MLLNIFDKIWIFVKYQNRNDWSTTV